ncbi:DUF421 domain-containing protein [Paenibacillus camelliae]|uniref:DUF421 domain-containing protein n=1 Tax=Paenibacillus camelliae TaxID=512410 RepID=UPI00203C43CB|nr:DUF421 domain-containing protein [Paenibacillus camelliae]
MMFMDILLISGRTIIAIALMFFLTKLLGKRQLSEMSLFGYISGISVGNIAAYIALEKNEMWLLASVSLCIWVLIVIILEKFTLKSKKMRKVVDGDRRILISNGNVIKEALRKENMTVEELLEKLRDKDVFRIADVEMVSMEPNGEISIFLKAEHNPLTPSMIGYPIEKEEEPITIIIDGSYEFDAMKNNGLDQNWVEKQLAKVSVAPNQVFIAQYTKDKSLSIHTMDQRTLEVNLEKQQNNALNKTEMEQIKKSLLQAIAIIEQQTNKPSG